MTDARLVAPAVAAWVACLLSTSLPAAAVIASVIGVSLATVAIVARKPTLSVILIAASIVCAIVGIAAPQRSPEAALDAAQSGRIVEVTIVVTQSVPEGSAHFRGELRRLSVGERTVTFARPVPVLVFDAADHGTQIGETVAVSAVLSSTSPADSTAFLVFAEGEPRVLEPAPAWLRAAGDLRAGFLEASTRLSGDGGSLLPGLAIGDTRAVSAPLDEAMTNSGLSHLTAVSGANCAIVIGLVLVIGARLRWPRPVRVVISVAVLGAFVILVTPEPSVIRASAMAVLVLAAVLAGRPIRGVPVIALAVIILLITDPWLSTSFAFALSVLATSGLVVLSPPLTRLLTRWMPLPLAAVIAIPVAAQVACQPVLILLQPSISVVGLVANILAAPAAPLATIVGLVACLALPIVPPLGEVLLRIAWVPSAWIASVARFFAGAPLAIPWLPGIPGALSLAVVTLLVLYSWLGTSFRRITAFLAAALLAAVGGIAVGQTVAASWGRPPEWTIALCDIGQGDAAIVRSAGVVMLIDTGPDPEPLEECLRTLGISRVNALVLTHFDLDHVGGVDAVVGKTDAVFIGPTATADDEEIVERLRRSGAHVNPVSAGAQGLVGELRWKALWPLAESDFEPGNDSSIVIHIDPVTSCVTGCLSALFLGDLGAESQMALARASPIPPVEVVKVAHHGSADQDAAIYESARATVGLIGVGENSYGHPTESLLGLLQEVQTRAYRTDRNGLILVSTSSVAGHLSIWSERPSDSGGT